MSELPTYPNDPFADGPRSRHEAIIGRNADRPDYTVSDPFAPDPTDEPPAEPVAGHVPTPAPALPPKEDLFGADVPWNDTPTQELFPPDEPVQQPSAQATEPDPTVTDPAQVPDAFTSDPGTTVEAPDPWFAAEDPAEEKEAPAAEELTTAGEPVEPAVEGTASDNIIGDESAAAAGLPPRDLIDPDSLFGSSEEAEELTQPNVIDDVASTLGRADQVIRRVNDVSDLFISDPTPPPTPVTEHDTTPSDPVAPAAAISAPAAEPAVTTGTQPAAATPASEVGQGTNLAAMFDSPASGQPGATPDEPARRIRRPGEQNLEAVHALDEMARQEQLRKATEADRGFPVDLVFPPISQLVYDDAQQILNLLASEARLQNVIREFILTRDRMLDIKQRQDLEHACSPYMGSVPLQSGPEMITQVFNTAYDELIGLGPLGPVWRDDNVTEILVDDWDKIYVERDGKLLGTNLQFRDLAHAQQVAKAFSRVVSDRELSPANPLVTAQLPGARITFAYGRGVVASGISISLRKFKPLLGMAGLLKFGSLNEEMRDFLKDCVTARATTLVSGGTGTGKTTMINALSEFIPKHERVVTIEDSLELQMAHTFVVSLQTKEKASADDGVDITQDMLLVNALRMRPDRIIVGEIREAKAATVMMQAANTGHEGTMTTIHANTPDRALNFRLSNMVLTAGGMPDMVAKQEVVSAVDLVIQVTRRLGRRYISEIATLPQDCIRNGIIQPQPIFQGRLEGDEVVFKRVGHLEPDSDMAVKMTEVGIDPSRWYVDS